MSHMVVVIAGLDYVDVAIGRCLAKGSRSLAKLIEETGFSRATIFNHLRHLRGIVLGEPIAVKRRGRPKLLYKLGKAIKLEAQTTSLGIVSIKFAKVKHAWRFEKGGYCKEERKACLQQTCPLIAKESCVPTNGDKSDCQSPA